MPKIQALKEAHPGEWIAIVIHGEGLADAEEGELVFHSHDHDEVWRSTQGDSRRIGVLFAGPPLPEGYAAAF